MKQELSWELIEQALDEKRLEILEDYNYFEWLQNEMRKIRKKYEKPEKQYVKPNLHADEMDWYDSIVQRIAREVKKDDSKRNR